MMFSELEWDWLDEYSKRALAWRSLGRKRQPSLDSSGSGSEEKNAPLSCFAGFARKWLDSKSMNRVTFSFGEADSSLVEFRKARDFQRQEGSSGSFGKLSELRKMLVETSLGFLGNDSGPGHLAASLGIPTRIVFRSTDRKIWAPLGRGSKLTNRSGKPRGFCKKPNRPVLPNLR